LDITTGILILKLNLLFLKMAGTHRTTVHKQKLWTDTEDENYGFVIEQDQSQDECPYCFCKPCITNEQNIQLWWHADIEEPHLRNSGLRKEHYKRFWTMLLHRGVWNGDIYVVMKADAMSRDPRRQRYDWHQRDIMPKCVVSLVRQV
jgi:hypothetical protein